MSPAPQPRMHGVSHAPNGPDPIPGLAGGGGTLEWEDVGSSTGGGGGIQMDTNNTGVWLGIEAYESIQLKAVDVSMTFTAPDFLFTGVPGDSNPAATSTDFTVNVGGNVMLSGGGGNQISVHYTGGIQLAAPTQTITLWPGNGNLTIVGLPTTNPGGTNRVWNDAGVLKIT